MSEKKTSPRINLRLTEDNATFIYYEKYRQRTSATELINKIIHEYIVNHIAELEKRRLPRTEEDWQKLYDDAVERERNENHEP